MVERKIERQEWERERERDRYRDRAWEIEREREREGVTREKEKKLQTQKIHGILSCRAYQRQGGKERDKKRDGLGEREKDITREDRIYRGTEIYRGRDRNGPVPL